MNVEFLYIRSRSGSELGRKEIENRAVDALSACHYIEKDDPFFVTNLKDGGKGFDLKGLKEGQDERDILRLFFARCGSSFFLLDYPPLFPGGARTLSRSDPRFLSFYQERIRPSSANDFLSRAARISFSCPAREDKEFHDCFLDDPEFACALHYFDAAPTDQTIPLAACEVSLSHLDRSTYNEDITGDFLFLDPSLRLALLITCQEFDVAWPTIFPLNQEILREFRSQGMKTRDEADFAFLRSTWA